MSVGTKRGSEREGEGEKVMGEEGKTEQKRGEQRTLFSMEGRRRSESERQRKRMQDSSSLSSSFVAVKISKRAAVA